MEHVADIYETRLRRVEDQQVSFMDAHSDLSRLIQGQSRHFDEIKTRLADLEGRMANTDKRLDGLEKRLDTVELRIERIELRIERVEARMDDLEATTRLGFEKIIMRLERQDEAIVALQQQTEALQQQSEQTLADLAYIKDILMPRATGQQEE